jgi:hypothetical protein
MIEKPQSVARLQRESAETERALSNAGAARQRPRMAAEEEWHTFISADQEPVTVASAMGRSMILHSIASASSIQSRLTAH